jgi:hypothetical protein
MSATQRRCHACRDWYDARHDECTHCGHPRHRFNKGLATAKLNSHLYAQAASADRERRLERTLR